MGKAIKVVDDRLKEEFTGRSYEDFLNEGRELIQGMSSNGWRLGELACGVKFMYGQSVLEKFAKEINIPYATLRGMKATAEAWSQIVARPTIWVASRLNQHPDRAKLYARKPNMTKEEAAELMAKHRNKGKGKVLNADGVAEEAIKLFDKMNDGSGELGELMASLYDTLSDLNPTVRSRLEDAMAKAIQRLQRDLSTLQANSGGVVRLEARRRK